MQCADGTRRVSVCVTAAVAAAAAATYTWLTASMSAGQLVVAVIAAVLIATLQ
jgi:hypothetical protein